MYLVEGNIGAGKSTFLRMIGQQLSYVHVEQEGHQRWDDGRCEDSSASLLASYYRDRTRWSYTLESWTMICRVQDHIRRQQLPHDVIIAERSVYSGHYGFAVHNYRSGALTELEWKTYQDLFSLLVTQQCAVPQGFIYLKASPELVYERMKKRARSSEDVVPLEYLQAIDRCHDDFLLHKRDVAHNIEHTPVLVLDCNRSFEHDHGYFRVLCDQVSEFIAQTSTCCAAQSNVSCSAVRIP